MVSHIRVASNQVPDLSNMEAWRKAFIREGMSDKEKALAVWKSVVAFRHQDHPPNEYLEGESNVHDPIKIFNVYGYNMCCCASANIAALARHVGLQARGRIIRGHSVPEVYWDGAWHMLDASLINYFPKADGRIASVDEITAGITAWYAANPGYKGDGKKLAAFMRNGGWKRGPAVLANSPFYDNNGWLPAATHGWYSTMQEYDGSEGGIYEYGCSLGYQVNIQLRPGERLLRAWYNKGLHVNTGGAGPGCISAKLRYAPAYGDLAPGRVGNGIHEYDVPAAELADSATAGELRVRMPSSYVYLSGMMDYHAVIGDAGSIAVQFSENNGLDWRELPRITKAGPGGFDFGKSVFRRYDYQLRFDFAGAGTGFQRLKLRHDVQHSQRALPALTKGENLIRFNAGPAEGTVTIEGSANPKDSSRQLVTSDFHAKFDGVRPHLLLVEGGQGNVTFPIATPGDMRRLRIGCHYRVRDRRDAWDLQVSFDQGKSYQSMALFQGPTPGYSSSISFDKIPPGTRSALVRFAGTQRNTTCIFSYRIDADYAEPTGGFQPVRVHYEWEEAGQLRQHAYVARSPQASYRIICAEKPTMKSIELSLAEEVQSTHAPILEPPTLHSLGVSWAVAGDGEISLHCRKLGSNEWQACPSLLQVEKDAHRSKDGDGGVSVPDGARLCAGSALLLEPDTSYELRVRRLNPPSEHILQSRTLAEPSYERPLRSLHVQPGDGGGDGSSQTPFRGLRSAQAQARPGDLFLLRPGIYAGPFVVDRKGMPAAPIIWRGPADSSAIIDAAKAAQGVSASGSKDVWFENLSIRNADFGLVAHESMRLVVRGCRISDVEYGITATRQGAEIMQGHFISDNTLRGPSTWPRSQGIESARGIQISGRGHVVCYNRISGFADAIDTFPSRACSAIDIHNNDISEMTDDGIEMDYSYRNTRCFHNRLTNVYNGISTQPVYGGPVYIFRNVMYNVAASPFKMNNSPSGALMLHNTSVKSGSAFTIGTSAPIRYCVFRNNLFIGTTAKYAFEAMPPMRDCDFDYDGFGGESWGKFMKWNGVRYDSADQVRREAPVYRHLIEIAPGTAFVGALQPPTDANRQVPSPPNLHLAHGSPAIDSGIALPGINDHFHGKAPDLGAYEFGSQPPHYGPRR